MKQLTLAFLLICLSLQFACTRGTEPTTEGARETVDQMTDSDLQAKIENQLMSDPELRHANLSVEADAERHWVTLSGTVPTEAMRTRAVEMARASHPGLTVDDRIEVQPQTGE